MFNAIETEIIGARNRVARGHASTGISRIREMLSDPRSNVYSGVDQLSGKFKLRFR
jgi:hypothetical protein